MKTTFSFLFAASLSVTLTAAIADSPPPTELPGLRWTKEFFPGTSYRQNLPQPESLLGFPLGQRAASAVEIERCLKAWTAAAPDRTRLVEYARSHEQRPLYYVIVTSPKNLARAKEIQAGYARLGDPRKTGAAEAKELIAALPPVAWLAYTIHGDETEGSDAALAVLYHLLAAEDASVAKLLDDLVIIVDPLMNPDGRDRFIKMIAEHRGTAPNVDDQSLLHGGYWPRGRGNHYLFDLNRDFIAGVNPESRGRIREVGRWTPMLFVDGHGMGPQETHLFSPPREPVNPHIPKARFKWGRLFAREQAEAFDRQGLVYYTGEWNEEWYPGFSKTWAAFRGVVGILYEQARIAEDGVRRPEGRILSYGESVRHHVIGSMANLQTLQKNARAIVEEFYNTRKAAVDPKGAYANRTFAILPSANRSRRDDFLALMKLQAIEVFEASTDFTSPRATDPLGRERLNQTIPAGTILIPNCQPLAHLVAAMLEFDPQLSPAVLAEERQELLLKGKSRIYDTTAWNLTMMFGLESLTLEMELPASVRPVGQTHLPSPGLKESSGLPVAYVFDGADDRSVPAAARLMERGVQVRAAEKPFTFDNHSFARGSVLVTLLDNRSFAGDLRQTIKQTAQELGLAPVAVNTGFGIDDLPDLGGRHFRRLEPPRVALMGRGEFNATDYGATWFVLDHHLGVRHSNLDESERFDFSRYNVIILPDRGSALLPANLVTSLKEWVKQGGTLIAVGGSTTALIDEKNQFSKVRSLSETLGRLSDYELALFREWLGRSRWLPPVERIWAHQATADVKYPWQMTEGPHPDEKELKKRDAWQKIFMPQGAILAGRVNTDSWLTFGCGEVLPVLAVGQTVLMAAEGVEAPVRYGAYTPVKKVAGATTKATASPSAVKSASNPKAAGKSDMEKKEKKESSRIGWAANPPGYELQLRMSGLLWPEASHRLANSACLTRESFGRGQIILFATPPNFRATARGTIRLFLNAVVYGPGFGAAQPIRP